MTKKRHVTGNHKYNLEKNLSHKNTDDSKNDKQNQFNIKASPSLTHKSSGAGEKVKDNISALQSSNEEISELESSSNHMDLSSMNPNQNNEDLYRNYRNKKLENFLIDQNRLSYSDYQRVLEAKNQLEETINKNNLLRGSHRNGVDLNTVNEKINTINQEAFNKYQEELLTIMGQELFSSYSIWNEKQEAEIAEMSAGGGIPLNDNWLQN